MNTKYILGVTSMTKPNGRFSILFFCILWLFGVESLKAQTVDTIRIYSKNDFRKLSYVEKKTFEQRLRNVYQSSLSNIGNSQIAYTDGNFINALVNLSYWLIYTKQQPAAIELLTGSVESLHLIGNDFAKEAASKRGLPFLLVSNRIFSIGEFLIDAEFIQVVRARERTFFVSDDSYVCDLCMQYTDDCMQLQAYDIAENVLYNISYKNDPYPETRKFSQKARYREAKNFMLIGRYFSADSVYRVMNDEIDNGFTQERADLLASYANMLSMMGNYPDAIYYRLKAKNIYDQRLLSDIPDAGLNTASLIEDFIKNKEPSRADSLFAIEDIHIKKNLGRDSLLNAYFLGVESDYYTSTKQYRRAVRKADTAYRYWLTREYFDNRSGGTSVLDIYHYPREFYDAANRISFANYNIKDELNIGRTELGLSMTSAMGPRDINGKGLDFADYLVNNFAFLWELDGTSNNRSEDLLKATKIYNNQFAQNLHGFWDDHIRMFRDRFSRTKDILLSLIYHAPDEELTDAAFKSESVFKAALYKSHSQNWDVTDFDNLGKFVKDGEALVDFVRFNFLKNNKKTDSVYYGAFVLLPGKTHVKFIPLFEQNELASLIYENEKLKSSFDLYAIQNDYHRVPGNTALKLKSLVWDKILSQIPEGTKIYYSPDGLLDQITMEAIAGKKGFISDDYSLVMLMDLTSIHIEQKDHDVQTFTLFGKMNYGKSDSQDAFPDIDETDSPIESIRKAISENHKKIIGDYVGQTAIEKSFYAVEKDNPDVLLFFTHGFSHSFDRTNVHKGFIFRSINPLSRCGLAMTGANLHVDDGYPNDNDQILTGTKIAGTDLSDVGLAILGACESGSGDLENGEGIWGLQRAFKLAGVGYIIYTTSKVDAAYTSLFLSKFLAALSSKNSKIESAFQETQKWYRRTYPESIEWSKWILMK